MVRNLVAHAVHLAGLEERTGRTVRLALEPEPCCFLETIEEAIGFFENHLFSSQARALVAGHRPAGGRRGCAAPPPRHLFDVCHAAVEFEDEDAPRPAACRRDRGPQDPDQRSASAGSVDAGAADLLRLFDDGVYFHQVVERSARGLTRYVDLDEAFASLNGAQQPREWRVHFHVPVFRDTSAVSPPPRTI
jgi:hypothetical protein